MTGFMFLHSFLCYWLRGYPHKTVRQVYRLGFCDWDSLIRVVLILSFLLLSIVVLVIRVLLLLLRIHSLSLIVVVICSNAGCLYGWMDTLGYVGMKG